MAIRVNPYFLENVLIPLSGEGDIEGTVDYASLKVEDETQVKKLIKERIKPCFDSRSVETKAMTLRTLSYYLSKPDAQWDRVFYSSMMPFNPPKDVRIFFVWIWEILKPQSGYQIEDLSGYVVDPDMNEANHAR